MRPPKCAECDQRMVFHHSDKANRNGTATLELIYACPVCTPEYFEEKVK